MKKQAISIAIAATTVASLIAGCGSNSASTSGSSGTSASVSESNTTSAASQNVSSSEQDTNTEASDGKDLSGTLSILSWYDETKAQAVLDGFKAKYPNVEVDFQYSPPVADYVEKLNTLLYSGEGPDIFYMALENREDLIKGNYCEDLSGESYFSDGTIPQSVIDTYGSDGKPYALAVDCWVGGIFYNKDLFAKAGIDKAPTTWDELLSDCKTLKDAGITPIMDNCQDAAVNFTAPLFGSEVKAKDPEIVKKTLDGETTFKDTWTTPIKMWREGLVDNGYVTADMIGATSDEIVTAFATEQTAMIISGSWNLGTINSINPNLNFECIPVPGTEDSYYCGAVNVGLCINSASEHKDLAKAFLEYAASPEGLEAQYKGYGGYTIASGYTPDLPKELKNAVDGVKNGKYYIPMADWFTNTESLRLTYIQALQDCMAGSITPEEAAGRLDDKWAEVNK